MTRTQGLLTALLLAASRDRTAGCRVAQAETPPPRQIDAKAKSKADKAAARPAAKAKRQKPRTRRPPTQVQDSKPRTASQGRQQEAKQGRKARQERRRSPPRARPRPRRRRSRPCRRRRRRGRDSRRRPASSPLVKQAIAHARAGTRLAGDRRSSSSIQDPVARKLVEWAILRSDGNGASSARYIAFINANPNWPSVGLLRRRAEAMMWTERPDPAAVRAYFAKNPPLTAKGQFALARALLAQGDRAGAQAQVRDAWRNDAFGADLEAQVLEAFGGLLTAADHKARMDMRLYAEDTDGGLRNAKRAGGNAPAIAKARIAVIKKAGNAKAALDAVPSERAATSATSSASPSGCAATTKHAEAGDAHPVGAARSVAGDRHRSMVDRAPPRRPQACSTSAMPRRPTASRATPPFRSADNYRAEHQFTAGWIALRFLNDPATALTHFARIAEGNANPITLARAHYWHGPHLEAQGRNAEARAALPGGRAVSDRLLRPARARAGSGCADIALRTPPPRAAAAPTERRARASSCSTPSASATWSPAPPPTSATARTMPARSPRSARSPRATTMRAPCCCWARRRSAAGCRSSTTRSRPSACRTTPRSARRSRQAAGLCDRPAGEHVQPADRLERHAPWA